MNALPVQSTVVASTQTPARGASTAADSGAGADTDPPGAFSDALDHARELRARGAGRGKRQAGAIEARPDGPATTRPGPERAAHAAARTPACAIAADPCAAKEAAPADSAAAAAAPDLNALLPGWPAGYAAAPLPAAVAAEAGAAAVAAMTPTPWPGELSTRAGAADTASAAIAAAACTSAGDAAGSADMPTHSIANASVPARSIVSTASAAPGAAPELLRGEAREPGRQATPPQRQAAKAPAADGVPLDGAPRPSNTPAAPEATLAAPPPAGVAAASSKDTPAAPAPTMPAAPLLPGAMPASPAPAATAPAAPPPATFEARLSAPFDSPSFAPALANQVRWLVNEGVQQARIALNPLEMGPVIVKIVLDGNQARIDFSATLAPTRAAIEAGLPTLAAALHDSGLTLAGGGVSDGQTRQGPPDGRAAPAATRDAHPASHALDLPAPATSGVRTARGLVDLVA